MTNIWVINFWSNQLSQISENLGDVIFSFGGFTVLKDCNSNTPKYFYDISIDIKDDAQTGNNYIVSELFEGVSFVKENYTLKDITLEVLMYPHGEKTIDQLVLDIKDIFAPIKWEILYQYRGEMMKLKAIKNSLKFNLKRTFPSFTVNFTATPFFESQIKQNLGSSFSWTSTQIDIWNDWNRIYPKMRVIPTGNCWGFTIGNSAWKARYIRDWANGSTANAGTHWVEIQAIEKNTWDNIALGRSVTSSTGNTTNISRITDWNLDTSLFFDIWGSGNLSVTVDLWSICDISEIKIWRFYADSRSYFNTKTEISSDGVNWITVFDSATEWTYKETALGKTHKIEEKNLLIDGKRTILENINSGEIIDIDFASGKVEKNGITVPTIWQLPLLAKDASMFLTFLDKYSYPSLNQSKDSKTGTSGSNIVSVTDSTRYFRVGQLFNAHSITYLKKITLWGNNIFAYSLFFSMKIYTSTAKTTLISEFSKNVYAGQNISPIIFDIEGEWLNISWYANIYIEIDIWHMSSLPSSSTEYFRLARTVTSTGTSYDYDMAVMTWNWDIVLNGVSSPYIATSENVTWASYLLEYFNNYL